MDIRPLFITLKVASFATLITFFLGILCAYTVVKMKKWKALVDSILTLPMILPPTVVGFLLLLLFGKNSLLGQFLYHFDISVIFSWIGAVIAAVVVSLPLMYRTTLGALESIDHNILYAARTLGISETKILIKICLPVSINGIIAGTVLSFARAIGEFGATIMLAGNIPGKTQTMSIAIYTAVQSGDRELAFKWVGLMCLISFSSILFLNWWSTWKNNRR